MINIVNKKILGVLLLLIAVSFANANSTGPGAPPTQPPMPPMPVGPGAGTPVGPGVPNKTPIDMYEGALMIVATSIIAGYYFVRNRKQVN